MSDIIERLDSIIDARRAADPGESYVARLLNDSEAAALRKVGEEATEVVIAGMGGDRLQFVRETADLWFHSLVALARLGCTGAEVLAELERRFGTSGLAEKAARSPP